MARVKKKERQEILLEKVKTKPFLTDEELARQLDVSVQTIRLTGWNWEFRNCGGVSASWR
jgi:hypothetical protein